MLFQIPAVLAADELDQLQKKMGEASLIDGKATAGWYAKQVKNNQQIQSRDGKPLETLLKKALQRHPLYQTAVRPKQPCR